MYTQFYLISIAWGSLICWNASMNEQSLDAQHDDRQKAQAQLEANMMYTHNTMIAKKPRPN